MAVIFESPRNPAVLEPLRCHAIDFGYLIDPPSGQLLRSYGRHLLRSTRGYPEGCMAVATPTRIAGHVGALPNAIDPAHEEPGALLILPSYRRDPEGALAGTWVTVQRIRLSPDEDSEDLPGDAVRSSSESMWPMAPAPGLLRERGAAAEEVQGRQPEWRYPGRRPGPGPERWRANRRGERWSKQ